MGRKHRPMRTCVGCRRVRGKREMIRVVRSPEGVVRIDPKGKAAGRGAYLCANAACWEKALAKGHLERALRTKLRANERAELQEHIRTFPRPGGQTAVERQHNQSADPPA